MVVLMLTANLLVAGVSAATVPASFDPACVSWQRLEFRAQKFLMSVHMDVEARVLTTLLPGSLWEDPELPGIAAGERTLALQIGTRGPGRRSTDLNLLLNPDSGALLQSTSLRGEPSPRFRVYRFTDQGPLRWSLRPAPDERGMPPASWSGDEAALYPYVGGPAEAPVVDVSSLLYLLSASAIAKPGDRIRVLGFASSSDPLYQVTASALASVSMAVNYRESGPAGVVTRRETRSVLPVRIEGVPRAASGVGGGLEILGLQDLEFLLDPERRVIVGFRARMPGFGRIDVLLQRLELAPVTRCTHPNR
jgi:hypothetical protein